MEHLTEGFTNYEFNRGYNVIDGRRFAQGGPEVYARSEEDARIISIVCGYQYVDIWTTVEVIPWRDCPYDKNWFNPQWN